MDADKVRRLFEVHTAAARRLEAAIREAGSAFAEIQATRLAIIRETRLSALDPWTPDLAEVHAAIMDAGLVPGSRPTARADMGERAERLAEVLIPRLTR